MAANGAGSDPTAARTSGGAASEETNENFENGAHSGSFVIAVGNFSAGVNNFFLFGQRDRLMRALGEDDSWLDKSSVAYQVGNYGPILATGIVGLARVGLARLASASETQVSALAAELIVDETVAARALPEALTVGKNAETGVSVYHGMDGGKAAYSGITNDLERRAAEHRDRFTSLFDVTGGATVTRGEARAIEEALIVRNRGQNLRHSISPNHSWYGEAVDWGEAWLRGNGY
jgi:hypothetical protein